MKFNNLPDQAIRTETQSHSSWPCSQALQQPLQAKNKISVWTKTHEADLFDRDSGQAKGMNLLSSRLAVDPLESPGTMRVPSICFVMIEKITFSVFIVA